MSATLWIAVLTALGGGHGASMDTSQRFAREADCRAFVARVVRQSADTRSMGNVFGTCVERSAQ